MKPQTLRTATRISILILFVILVGVLIYSLFYYKEISCNAQLEFPKINNCSNECPTDCIQQGFPMNANHTAIGEKIYVSSSNDHQTKKDSSCVCECLGCRN